MLPISRFSTPKLLSLYLVANRPSYQDEHLFISKIKSAVQGGVSCVQFRDYKNDYQTTLKTACHLKELLNGIPLFVNTLHSLKLAHAVEAEGVYLEEKISYVDARKQLGQKAIIGIPVKTMSDVLAAGSTSDIDYISVKLFPSKKTCPKNDELWGMEGLKKIRSLTPHRIVAIGGLNLEAVENVYRALNSEDGIAMAGGLMEEINPCETAQKIQAIRRHLRGEV